MKLHQLTPVVSHIYTFGVVRDCLLSGRESAEALLERGCHMHPLPYLSTEARRAKEDGRGFLRRRMNAYAWYQTLIKPNWAPPSWLFAEARGDEQPRLPKDQITYRPKYRTVIWEL